MKKIGIICEYNPFHNGHLYHINKIKEIFPNCLIILVMSGNFTQRGDVSIIDKWDKTKIALEYGVDLVAELPFAYASQSADIFSKGALKLLNNLKVDYIVFGSESNNVEILTKLAKLQLEDQSYNNLIKEYLKEGINYPTALSKALKKISKIDVSSPNDILGLSYIREIIKNNYKIKAITIQRTNDFHQKNADKSIASATSIRNLIKTNKSIDPFVPRKVIDYLKQPIFLEDYFLILKYKILSSADLSIYQTVDEGIENRVYKSALVSNNLEELIMNIKTKRYTYNKITRMLVHILCDFTKEEAKLYFNDFVRILGFNNLGKDYLNSIKKDINIPLITNFSTNHKQYLTLDSRVSNIYNLLKINKKIEHQQIPFYKKN